MAGSIAPDTDLIRQAFACKCPKCGKGDIYKPGLTLDIREQCEVCGLKLAENDTGDGPAVFLIFILGFSLVPLALLLEWTVHPPLWVHAIVWGSIATFITLGALRPLKAYIIALQWKHRPEDWQ